MTKAHSKYTRTADAKGRTKKSPSTCQLSSSVGWRSRSAFSHFSAPRLTMNESPQQDASSSTLSSPPTRSLMAAHAYHTSVSQRCLDQDTSRTSYLWSKLCDLEAVVPRHMNALAVPSTFVIWVEVQTKPDIIRFLCRLFFGECILDNDKSALQELVDLFLYSQCFSILLPRARGEGQTHGRDIRVLWPSLQYLVSN